MSTTPITFRISPEELASALEGLTNAGHPSDSLSTITSIVRTTFYYGLIYLKQNPDKLDSHLAKQKINQLINQNKKNSNISIQDIMKRTN